MGEIVEDESIALSWLKALPQEARGIVGHHLRNSLMKLSCIIETSENLSARDYKLIHAEIIHIKEDLERFSF